MDKKAGEKPETAAATTPAGKPEAALDSDATERAAKFDRLDKEKAGKFTREYYTTHQSDAEAAGQRFEKMDVNKDGFITREEYIANGGKKPKSK